MERSTGTSIVWRKKREQRDVIVGARRIEKLGRRSAVERCPCRLTQGESNSVDFRVRFRKWQPPLAAENIEQRARGVLGLLHVRFIERIDRQQSSSGGGGHFPSHE